MKKEFVDYSEIIQKTRTNILKDCSEIIESDSRILLGVEEDVSIIVVGDNYNPEKVIEIEKRGDTILIITEDDTESNLADLETDDMVAIYEYIYSFYHN